MVNFLEALPQELLFTYLPFDRELCLSREGSFSFAQWVGRYGFVSKSINKVIYTEEFWSRLKEVLHPCFSQNKTDDFRTPFQEVCRFQAKPLQLVKKMDLIFRTPCYSFFDSVLQKYYLIEIIDMQRIDRLFEEGKRESIELPAKLGAHNLNCWPFFAADNDVVAVVSGSSIWVWNFKGEKIDTIAFEGDVYQIQLRGSQLFLQLLRPDEEKTQLVIYNLQTMKQEKSYPLHKEIGNFFLTQSDFSPSLSSGDDRFSHNIALVSPAGTLIGPFISFFESEVEEVKFLVEENSLYIIGFGTREIRIRSLQSVNGKIEEITYHFPVGKLPSSNLLDVIHHLDKIVICFHDFSHWEINLKLHSLKMVASPLESLVEASNQIGSLAPTLGKLVGSFCKIHLLCFTLKEGETRLNRSLFTFGTGT